MVDLLVELQNKLLHLHEVALQEVCFHLLPIPAQLGRQPVPPYLQLLFVQA